MSWEMELVERLSTAPYGNRSNIIREYAGMTGKSSQTIYRIARRHGFDSGRRQRADAGECVLTEDQLDYVTGLINTSRREIKGTILPVEDALGIAEDNGVIEKGCISASGLARVLREQGRNRTALNAAAPHIQMRSLHPNHVHVFDMSVCIQYYLRGGGMTILDERNFYKNKPDNYKAIRHRLIRYVLTDHFSGSLFLKYYYAAGETQENLFDFLTAAWGGKDHEKWPFRGVPLFVLMDAGAANTSRAMIAWMERLGIRLPAALPHNPRRQGQAEKAQNIVETKFESRLRFQPAATVDDLNAWAVDWCVWFNGKQIHARHRMTRTQAWLKIKTEQLRELPDRELLRHLFANPSETRKVSGRYAISYKGREYDLRHIPGMIPNLSTVNVVLKPFDYPNLTVRFNREDYEARPIGTVEGGFREDAAVIGEEFKRMPDSVARRHIKSGDRAAYGETGEPVKPKDRKPFAGATVFGNHAEKVAITPIPKQGVAHEVTQQAADMADASISLMEFFNRLRPVTGTITPELNRTLRQKYRTSIPLAEAHRLVDAARNGRLAEALADDAAAAVAGSVG